MILLVQSKGRITVREVTNIYKSDALSAEFLPRTPDIYGSHHPDYRNEFHGMASRHC
jgi:hypothetical protein